MKPVTRMHNREYPEHPLVGVGGVVISGDRVLLARRGTEPLRGEWSIPGGLLELGETLTAGVARELREETGLTVRAIELIDAFDRIFVATSDGTLSAGSAPAPGATSPPGDVPPAVTTSPQYHYVLLDYLCEVVSGEPRAGSDVTDLAFVRENELPKYTLAPMTLDVIRKAFAMARARQI